MTSLVCSSDENCKSAIFCLNADVDHSPLCSDAFEQRELAFSNASRPSWHPPRGPSFSLSLFSSTCHACLQHRAPIRAAEGHTIMARRPTVRPGASSPQVLGAGAGACALSFCGCGWYICLLLAEIPTSGAAGRGAGRGRGRLVGTVTTDQPRGRGRTRLTTVVLPEVDQRRASLPIDVDVSTRPRV